MAGNQRAGTGSSPVRPSHLRSLGGCLTCRKRKIKCDETQPKCRKCLRSGRTCGGYEAKVRFVHYHPDYDTKVGNDADGGHGRRVLFSVAERASMSKRMRNLVNEDAIDQLLEFMDFVSADQAHRLTPDGPFRVFKANHAAPPSPAPAVMHNESFPPPSENNYGFAENSAHVPDETNTQQVATKFDVNPETSALDLLDDDAIIEDVQDDSMDFSFLFIDPNLQSEDFRLTSTSPINLHLPPKFNGDFQTTVTSHAHFLLDHYKSQMTKLFSPLRVRKSPWSILHFPRALSALAEISVFQKTKHAHASLFYSILAVSAFNWDNIYGYQNNSTTYWRGIGDSFRHEARNELQMACETELAGDKCSKYKDILMAILTMVTISVVTGQQDEARSYLLNAEMFISLRGVTKIIKSKKVKLLHSIYLFLRIIEESTYIYPLEKQQFLQNAPPRSKEMKFPSLRTHSRYQGRDLDDSIGFDFEVGLFGQLDDPQDKLLFQEIYGFPQELLSFISRTTALANEIIETRNQLPGISMTSELEGLCTELENDICSWKHHDDVEVNDIPVEDQASSYANRTIMAHLIAAFHSATTIYFYRRVRQLHPLPLQHLVEKTVNHLQAFDQEQQRFSILNCGIVWPGFIAGAEALDPDLQARFEAYLRGCADKSGMRNFATSADSLQNLWNSRRERGDDTLTWMNLVWDKRLSLVLT